MDVFTTKTNKKALKMSDATELKPCPFCGSGVKIRSVAGRVKYQTLIACEKIACEPCYCVCGQKDWAINKWNNRPIEQALTAERDALRAANADLTQLLQAKSFGDASRFEVIDHTATMQGRALVKKGVKVELSRQDHGQTLKVFLTDRDEKTKEHENAV